MDKVYVFNPLKKDFTVQYTRVKTPELFTVRAMEIEGFDPDVANHVKKHLIDAVMNERGVKVNPEIDTKAIFEEISVSL